MSRAAETARRAVQAVRIRPSGRRCLLVTGVAVAVVLLARPAAMAGDLLSNVGPASQLEPGSLMDAHPLGHYVLDHHFAAVKAGVLSGVDVSGIPPTIAWFLANMLWQLTAFLAHALITLFTFAFSLDLVGGSGANGGASALQPVARAVRSIYQRTFGEPWLIVAVLLAGLWAIYNALVRRRYVETAGSLAVSVVFVVIALAFVTQPERTIGSASKWSNAMSGAFLSLTSQGTVSDQGQAKQSAADQLFTLLVYDPWTVLQFGGREQCVKAPVGEQPASVPVRPLSENASRDGDLSRRLRRAGSVTADGKVCVSNRNKHAPRFLRFPSGSDERDRQYEALKAGDRFKLDDDDPAKADASFRLGPADTPAADAMGKGGQYERLLMAIVIFTAELGIFLLLGALSIAVILAQVLVLLLMAFAPVALVVGVFPGRGHEFFLGWLSKLAAFLLRKAIYSLILAVLLAVGAAIDEASSSLGWLMAFGLQGAFYWAVFLYRAQLAGHLTLATTGPKSGSDHGAARLAALYAAARGARRALPSHRNAGPPPRARTTGPVGRSNDPTWSTPPPPEAPALRIPADGSSTDRDRAPSTADDPPRDVGGNDDRTHRVADQSPTPAAGRPASAIQATAADLPAGSTTAPPAPPSGETRPLAPTLPDAGPPASATASSVAPPARGPAPSSAGPVPAAPSDVAAQSVDPAVPGAASPLDRELHQDAKRLASRPALQRRPEADR